MGIFSSIARACRSLFIKDSLEDFKSSPTREELIRKSRILIIDDERIGLIDDLIKEGFSVDHDNSGADVSKIQRGLYDVILLDFAGVGGSYGGDQGLSLLKHIRRINPAVFILAYTSKSLPAKQSDFYRLTDGTLRKDSGVQESLEKIEDSLNEAFNITRLWNAILELTNIPPASREREKLEKILLKSIKEKDENLIKAEMRKRVTQFVDSLPSILLEKLLWIAMKAMIGAS